MEVRGTVVVRVRAVTAMQVDLGRSTSLWQRIADGGTETARGGTRGVAEKIYDSVTEIGEGRDRKWH
jgi:hypothetical protein